MKIKFSVIRPAWVYCVVTLIIAAVFFSNTNPTQIPSLWLIIGFGIMTALIYWTVRSVIAILGFYSKRIASQRKRLVRGGTILVAILFALQSAGQLTLKDIAVLLPLTILSFMYFSYSRKPLVNR
ncbi:MAG TPA: hypothetical protein VFN56_04475 [Candidatus Saccharimonadales bacterium]|nr:hypothetical protein [Candidatus Saccharimonadales bacterium]